MLRLQRGYVKVHQQRVKRANAEKKRANAEFKIKFPGQRQKKGELAPISLLCSYCQTAYSEEPQKIESFDDSPEISEEDEG